MRNTLGDLNLHLFAQLERLGDEDVKNRELEEEIKRAEAVSKVASRIINNGNLVLKSIKHAEDALDAERPMPKMLEG